MTAWNCGGARPRTARRRQLAGAVRLRPSARRWRTTAPGSASGTGPPAAARLIGRQSLRVECHEPERLGPRQRFEPHEKLLLGFGRAPWSQIVLAHCRRQSRIAAEQTLGLGGFEACKLSGFEIGRTLVGALDGVCDLVGQRGRQTKTNMDRREQALLDRFVV